MQSLYNVILVLHFVGLASLLGGEFARDPGGRITGS